MLRSILLVVSLVFCLVAVPFVTYAQVTNLAQNPSLEEDEIILDDPDWAVWYTWGWEAGLESTIAFDQNEFIDGTRSLRIEPKGVENWHFIVANDGIVVTAGATCTVSFWSKAEEARPFTAQIKATDNSVSFAVTDFELTTEWNEYTFTFEAQVSEIKVEMFCAGSEVPFRLDFLYVYEGEHVEGIMPSETVSPVEPAGKLAVRWAELKTSH